MTTNSCDESRKSRKKYADAVRRHANRSRQKSLYPGDQYEFLAQYLQKDTVEQSGDPARDIYTAGKRPHSSAVLHDLAFPRKDSRYLTRFSGSDGPQLFMNHRSPQSFCGQLLFLRGWPSPAWINAIGTRYNVNPEIFRRHIHFGQNSGHAHFPNLPPCQNIICLSMSTLGTHKALASYDENSLYALYNYFKRLYGKPDSEGYSIMRQIWSYNDDSFVIEQNALISLLREDTGWIGMFSSSCLC